MKHLILFLCALNTILYSQTFNKSILINIPGENIHYDFKKTWHPDYKYEMAFICFENRIGNSYSIILKQLSPFRSDVVVVYSDTTPQINPTITFMSNYDIRIIWQSRIDQTWQLLSRIFSSDSMSSVVQITRNSKNNISPSLHYSYLCWLQDSDLSFGIIDDSLHSIRFIDNNCSNPEIMHEYAMGPTTIDIVYEKLCDSHQLIKYASFNDRNQTIETKTLSDSLTNINPKFGYSLSVSYQKLVDGCWNAVVCDQYGYENDLIFNDRSYNIENPVYFSYLLPTNLCSIRDFFLVYESDSVQVDKEIILEFFPNWDNKSSINISNLPGHDTNPYATVIKDSVVIFWVNRTDKDNSQIWWSKSLFKPYANIENFTSQSICKFTLSPNYPNPFNPMTTIEYSVAEEADICISVYDLLGDCVCTLVDSRQNPGSYRTMWDGYTRSGHAAASGIYLIRLESKGIVLSQKILLLK